MKVFQLPVAGMHLDVVELVAGKIEGTRDLHARQIGVGRPRSLEESPFQFSKPALSRLRQVAGKNGGADQLSASVIGPAVDGADDRPVEGARPLEHDGLPVAANIDISQVPGWAPESPPLMRIRP